MKQAWIALAVCLVLLSCGVAVIYVYRPTETATRDRLAKDRGKPDSTKTALEMLRQAPSIDRYKEGVRLLNASLAQSQSFRDKVTLNEKARAFLATTVGLNGDELSDVESVTFRPADAYHLAEAFLFRDVARLLEIPSAADQADLCFRWVTEHVLLHEQGEESPPPAYVVRRGYGSARDRAVVFLALMRQFQIEGAVLVLPGAAEEVALVGVLDPSLDSVRLFDPRLGMPVRTTAGKVASLKDVQADTKLLGPSELTADQIKSGQWKVVCSLYSVPPRMRELERALAAYDRVALYCDVAKLKSDLERSTGMAVSVWNAAGNAAPSPVRALRSFVPADDGGTDKEMRLKRLEADRLPGISIVLALRQIKLGPEHLVNPALQQLMIGIMGELIERYDVQPAEMLLRGKDDEATERLKRIGVFLEAYTLSGLADDAEAQQEISQWRAQAATAYEALAVKDPRGQGLVSQLWGEDKYLLALLQVDSEEPPERYPKKLLTRIVAHAVRDQLDLRVRWMRAQLWQDKAEREQVVADHAAGSPSAAASAQSAWLNAKVNWRLYLDKNGLGPQTRPERIEAILALLRRPPDERGAVSAMRQLQALHLGLHQHYAAMVNQARALHFEGDKAALDVLRAADKDLSDLLAKQPPTDEPALKRDVDTVLAALQGKDRQMAAPSAALLQRDWSPQGNFYWLQRHVRRQIELWEKS